MIASDDLLWTSRVPFGLERRAMAKPRSSRTIYPGSRIARLPERFQSSALLLRALVAPGRGASSYVYNHDGLATEHFSPFLEDPAWNNLYWDMARRWFPGSDHVDVRWRMWTLTEWARASDGRGSFAEFGTWRAGCASMVLSLTTQSSIHLFDTFAGQPDRNLTDRELTAGFAGRLGDTSVEYVESLLDPWRDRVHIHPGDIFDTLESVETGPLALVHMDLNASSATGRALDYVHSRMVQGGVVVFDDYGAREYAEQRDVIDAYYEDRPDRPIAIPTGQAVLVMLHADQTPPQ